MRTGENPLLGTYVAAVSTVGLGLLVLLPWTIGFADVEHASVAVYLFLGFAVLGELMPIRIRRGSEPEEITTSTTFTYAILLSAGIVPALIAQAIASLVGDLAGRKPLWKAAFNVAQTTIALAAAGEVLTLLTDLPRWDSAAHLQPADIPAILLSGAVFFTLNHILMGVALAVAQRLPVLNFLGADFAFQALTAGMLLALSPAVVIVADFNVLLVPLLALPVIAVYRSANASLENAHLVSRLEQSLSQLREQAAKNEHQALHDALTDLPNRVLFHDRIDQAIRLATRQGSAAAVLIMDLDHFKEINDTLGHHNGDQLLRQIGARLQGMLRESDTIARLGGDEFGILLPGLSDRRRTVMVAEKILDALTKPFVAEGLALEITGSIGIALFPDHGAGVDALIQRADVAMYVAKAAHTGIEVYQEDQDRYSPDRLALAGELRRAIDEEELVLHYQPKADLKTGQIASLEALVRWRHPERGLLLPERFMPLAEHTELMRPLTSFVLDAALGQARALQDVGFPLPVSVNLSARNLSDFGLPDEVGGLLAKWGLSARCLEVEITETSIMSDPGRALEVLRRLRAMGVVISIDDFGTGYSSLAFLKNLPIGEIKIDKSFVLNMVRADGDAVIVRSTIDLGRNLGLRVVAEGVETQDVWARLAALGCDLAQGYLISEPIPSGELVGWLARAEKEGSLPFALLTQPRSSTEAPTPAPGLAS